MKKKIRDMEIGSDISAFDLISQFRASGVFGAGRVERATSILKDMMDFNAHVYMGLAGAMVPAGLRRVVSQMISRGIVDTLVSTGANITHDLMCSLGIPQWRDVEYSSDAELKEKGVNRIYDSFLEEGSFQDFESKIQPLLDASFKSLPGKSVSPSDLIGELGSRIEDPSSIVRNAHDSGVPIFIPAFTDSILGLQTYFYSQSNDISVDVMSDLDKIISTSFESQTSGAVLVGGGVPKNFILQSKMIAPTSLSYCIQITTDRPEPGGLSGATLEEAVSWGKIENDARAVTVYGDATIILPLIIAGAKIET